MTRRKNKPTRRDIYCCQCADDVRAQLVTGADVYPHRQDLAELPFWRCPECSNFVGCHHKTTKPTRPLGVIATQEIKNARKKIHALIDPYWKSKRVKRGTLYFAIASRLGLSEFHSGDIRDLDEARDVYRAALKSIKDLQL